MKINQINPSAYTHSFNARFRVEQNQKRELPILSPLQYGAADSDKFLYYQDFFRLVSDDGISPLSKTYDSFTGLRDKNYLMAILNKAIKDSKNSPKTLSVAMFDMDNFKSVNELLGYETGDDFIKIMSKNISEASKNHGVPAYRFGGDEFILVFNGESENKKNQMVYSILSQFKSDEYIKSKAEKYKQNAEARLQDYIGLSAKIHEITRLKERKSILIDLALNFQSDEAKYEPYLIQQIENTESQLRQLYSDLLNEAVIYEENEDVKNKISSISKDITNGMSLAQIDESVDEYLCSIFDKSAEIYQLRQWLKDYDKNDGFSFTSAIVNFTPKMLIGKKPIGIINEVGESLKQGKSICKGQSY